MVDVERIPKGMEVLDTVAAHVGVVEHHEGSGLRLSHRDAPDHQHHYIPHHWIARVEDHVHLNRAAADVFDTWPGGYPTGLAPPSVTAAKPVNWKAWGAAAAGGVALLLAML